MHRWSWWRPTRPPKSGFRIIIFDLLRNPLGKIRNILKGIERFKYTNKPQTHSRIHSQSQKIRCRASVKCKPNKLYLSEYEYADAKPKEKGNPIYIFCIFTQVCVFLVLCVQPMSQKWLYRKGFLAMFIRAATVVSRLAPLGLLLYCEIPAISPRINVIAFARCSCVLPCKVNRNSSLWI